MSSLLKEIESFSTKRQLKAVDTVITTSDGKKFTESRAESGDIILTAHSEGGLGFCPDLESDWNVGVVMPNVLVSSQDVAYNKPSLTENGVTHILNVAAGLPNAFPSEYQYCNVEMYDVEEEDIMKHYPQCEQFIDSSLECGGTVLIHCRAGQSRSVSIAIAYLMHKKQISCQQSLEIIRKTRLNVCPNKGFLKQLETLEKVLN